MLRMPINTLKIENFKSIKHLLLDCKKVNLFIGEPNTGKSNILEAIGLLSHVCHGHIGNFVRYEVMTDLFYDRILDNPIFIRFDDTDLKIEFKDGKFSGFTEQTIEGRKSYLFVFSYDYSGGQAQHLLEIFKVFKFYRFSKRSDFRNQKSEFLQPPDGDNLLAVVMTRKRFKEVASNIFGKFGYRLVFRPQEGKIEVFKELEDVIFSIPYYLASETLQRLIFYLAAIYSNKDAILAFEEPEAHAFPYYTKYLAERIALDENNNQYFIATHNPYFLTSILEKTPKQEVEIFATRLENYQTKVRPLTEKQKKEILTDMGYDIFFNIEKILSQRKGK